MKTNSFTWQPTRALLTARWRMALHTDCTMSNRASALISIHLGGGAGKVNNGKNKGKHRLTIIMWRSEPTFPAWQLDSLTAWWLLTAALLSLNGKSLSHCWGFEQILSSCSAYFSNWGTVIFDPFNCHKTCLKYPWWNLTLERQYICKRVRNVLYIPHEH